MVVAMGRLRAKHGVGGLSGLVSIPLFQVAVGFGVDAGRAFVGCAVPDSAAPGGMRGWKRILRGRTDFHGSAVFSIDARSRFDG